MSDHDLGERIRALEVGQEQIVKSVDTLVSEVKSLTNWQARMIGAGVFFYAVLGIWVKINLK